ncbi:MULTISPECIES: hypothetical protein [unclassified Streptomyces]|uniref:hypothetical protein n=1 Tax=unclassified Streptomyces TaxID=2593676 RepID=UPI0004C778F5|nr:hypothetical protein [Streptomyces sp. NRRL F-5630]
MRSYQGPALLLGEGTGVSATGIDVVVSLTVLEPSDGPEGHGEPWTVTLEAAAGSRALADLAGLALLLRLPTGAEGEVLLEWVSEDTEESGRATGNGPAPV